jgi:hypothetical protein
MLQDHKAIEEIVEKLTVPVGVAIEPLAAELAPFEVDML